MNKFFDIAIKKIEEMPIWKRKEPIKTLKQLAKESTLSKIEKKEILKRLDELS